MQKKSLIIIGAGISGLSLAWYMRKKYPEDEITIIDGKEKIGGVIETINDEFFFERGPRTFHSSRSLAFLELINDLSLEDKVIYADQSAKARFIYMENRLHEMPKNPWEIVTSRLTKGIWGAVLKDLKARPQMQEDESVYDFFLRHLGKKMTMQIIDPFFTGIYGGDITKLSILATMPKFKEWENSYGSLLKASFKNRRKKREGGTLFTIKDGLERFCQILFERSKVNFIPNFFVESVAMEKGQFIIRSKEKDLIADNVCSTILLPNKSSFIHKKSLSVLNIAYGERLKIPKGFGYLVPSSENETIKGVIFDSSVFPEQNRREEETRLTVIMDPNDKEEEVALNALRRHLKIEILPKRIYMKYYHDAIVQPQIFHKEKVREVLAKEENITCLGTHLYGVALNDCIAAAKTIAGRF